MGYFPNGTAGELYEEEYCVRCIHYETDVEKPGCPVWTLHLWHNYEEADKPDSFLHVLIPLDEQGDNQQCAMFHERVQR